MTSKQKLNRPMKQSKVSAISAEVSIVERLRVFGQQWLDGDVDPQHTIATMCWEAADEIERWREKYLQVLSERNSPLAEIERLHVVLRGQMEATAENYREVERLRAALQAIANSGDLPLGTEIRIAREALRGADETTAEQK